MKQSAEQFEKMNIEEIKRLISICENQRWVGITLTEQLNIRLLLAIFLNS